MKRFIWILAVLVVFGAVAFFYASTPPEVRAPVRVGWQTAWALQGQLVQSIENTNVRELYDSRATFFRFQYGPDLNEQALNGGLDAVNAGVVPILNLVAKDPDWVICARIVNFEIAMIAAPDSGLTSPRDLKGKVVGIPIGGGSHPYAIQLLVDNGLSYSTEGEPADVSILNVPPTEMATAMAKGAIQAAAVWEPTLSRLLALGGKRIDSVEYVGFLAVRKSFAEANPEEIVRLLKVYTEASYFVARNRAQADEWFAQASGLAPELVKSIVGQEPNFSTRSSDGVNLEVKFSDAALLQKVATTMYQLSPRLLEKEIRVGDFIDMSYLQRAQEDFRRGGFASEKIDIKHRD